MKKRFIVVLAIMAIFLGLGLVAFAAEYPTKPINLIIQYPAGGSTDVTARALANGAKKYLGQPVICENKAGGGGTVGVALVAAKPGDGYTIGIVTSSPTMAFHMGKLNFHPLNDLTPIIRWGNYLFGITVRADSQFKTMKDVMQYIKQNPEKLSYGSPGVGTPPHLAMEELSMVANVKFTHIPAKGIAENNTALLGGHMAFCNNLYLNNYLSDNFYFVFQQIYKLCRILRINIFTCSAWFWLLKNEDLGKRINRHRLYNFYLFCPCRHNAAH